MGITIEYTNPYGQTVTFNEGAPIAGAYTLVDYEGLDGNMMTPHMQKSPYQVGSTITGSSHEARVVVLNVMIYETTDANLHTKMRELSRALAVRPTAPGQLQTLGKLKATVNGVAYEIEALPQMSPQFTGNEGEGVRFADIEFICPRPNWKSFIVTTSATVAAPLSVTVNNLGDMPTSAIFTLTGPLLNPRIELGTQVLSFNYYLLVGETIVVNTKFGNKTAVWSKAGSPSMNMLPYVNHATSTFFELQPGNNVVYVKRSDSSTGTMKVQFQSEYSGIGA